MMSMQDGTVEGTVSAVWICDSCGKAFRPGRKETVVHTAETGHQNYHLQSFIVQDIGDGRIAIIKVAGNIVQDHDE